MDFLKQITYPSDSEFVIKQQFKTKKGDLYIICTDGTKWRLYMIAKKDKSTKLKESKVFTDINDLIPQEK